MHPARLLRSSTFRLTLYYAAVLGASAMIVLGFVYWAVANFMSHQLEASIEAEITELTIDAGLAPSSHVASMVADLIRRWPRDPVVFRVDGPDGSAIAGNMPAIHELHPRGESWFDAVPASRHDGGNRDALRIKAVKLGDGGRLLVGEHTSQLDDAQEFVFETALVGLAITAILALVGGVLMSRRALGRIEAINRTGSEIMAGDLTRRIPITGTSDDYDRLAENLNAMLDRIQALMEGMRQVSNDIAHDLRTPLTRLRNRLEAARTQATSVDDYAEAVDDAIRETDAVLATFRALLRIAQMEAGAGRSGFVDVDLGHLLRRLVEVYVPVAEERGYPLIADIAADVHVHGDPDLLLQMFSNVLENALLHTPAGTQIELRMKPPAAQIAVTVSDNGPGIPPDARDKVFQRFYRLDSSRSAPGSGLGLSLVAAVATLHDIDVTLDDNNPGLSVRMVFPSSASKLSHGAAGSASALMASGSACGPTKTR